MWSELGHAYLAAGQVPDAIAAYLRSNDVSKYAEVIDACKGGCVWVQRVLTVQTAAGPLLCRKPYYKAHPHQWQ